MKKIMESFKKFINEGEVIDIRTKKALSPDEIKSRVPYDRAVKCLRGYIEAYVDSEDVGASLSDDQFDNFVEFELKEFIHAAETGKDFDTILSALAYEGILSLRDKTDSSAMKYYEMKGCYEKLKK